MTVLRIGGILSDLFGVNGRRVLDDGLVAEHSPRCILAGLTSHVRARLAPLAKALAATLDPLALFALQIQLQAVARADAGLATLEIRIQAALADYQRPLWLLQTIPGIDRGSACTILVEIGPCWRARGSDQYVQLDILITSRGSLTVLTWVPFARRATWGRGPA